MQLQFRKKSFAGRICHVLISSSSNQTMPAPLSQRTLASKKSHWKQIQNTLKQKLSLTSSFHTPLTHIAGLDISFSRVKVDAAIASLIVLDYATQKPVYKAFKQLRMTEPYIAGYLAFREVNALCDLWRDMRNKIKSGDIAELPVEPQIAMIDGNGIHHQRGFGLACHFGVLMDVPCIGVAKNLLVIDGLRIETVKALQDGLKDAGDHALLRGNSGTVWSALLKGSSKNKNCVYVSQGHRVSLQDAVKIVSHCSIFKNPEPVRQADLLSREEIRVMDKMLLEVEEEEKTKRRQEDEDEEGWVRLPKKRTERPAKGSTAVFYQTNNIQVVQAYNPV